VQKEGSVEPMNEQEQKLFDRYTKELKLNSEVSNILARDENLSSFFQEALDIFNSAVNIANLVANDVAKQFKQHDIQNVKFTPKHIANLVKLIDEEIISTKIAKDVFEIILATGDDPLKIVEDKGLKQISDPDVILSIIDEVIEKNQDNVQKYKNGNKKLFGFFVGQVLKATNGKANPKVVNELVTKQLDS
jgi:glutaminyl-tRNA synthetase